ncbi:DUF4132 domain-containing protein [Planctomicrobium piriforme]|uniref:WGR domain-containing protein, predicted DNA-binding domain in MolR n=1 Tax=Planctomicrobium piriforme TaxID=1576369 RepID=A0A1I3E172_9PLAN|nr:DUF4132 domain-containing protein [Planctomicrobium piriforme]SFH92653.1 WGR domain-containing protein, predicted DNA-binding domain in MolR [Planctomicrobium piriforme]
MVTASRSLEFSDGSSNKFWNIELNGTEHTVTFGKIGTSGQSQTKNFGSEDEAKKSYDKLVAEKSKKGYVDKAGATGASATKLTASKPAAPKVTAKTTATSHADDAALTVASPTVSTPVASTLTADVDLGISREFDLTVEDWGHAHFRRSSRHERGTAAPFDIAHCTAKLAKLKTNTYGWEVRWDDLRLPPAISREEAHFWLVAITEWSGRETALDKFAENLAKPKKPYDGKLTVDQAWTMLMEKKRSLAAPVGLSLVMLFGSDGYVQLMLEHPEIQGRDYEVSRIESVLLEGFVRYVLPYLDDKDSEKIKKQIAKNWDPTQTPSSFYERFPFAYYLAAVLGMPDHVYQVTSQLEPQRYLGDEWTDHYQRPQDLVLGLGNPELIASEWRRLHLKMRSGNDVRRFVGCTEDTALDCVVQSVLKQTNKDACEEQLKALALVRTPTAAVAMLECKLSAKVPSPARDWLDKNVGRSIVGLVETAAGTGKMADAAVEYLRGAKAKGFGSAIQAAIKSCPNPIATAKVQAEVLDYETKTYQPLDAKSTPEWLSEAVNAVGKIKAKRLPGWASAATLPPLCIGEKRLNDEQTALVLQLLAAAPMTTKHPLLTALRDNLPRATRDEFAWGLFRVWQEDGFPSKDKWAMGAIGHLGDDGCVLKLTPMIRVWPGESQHARAVFGLECLRAIGSSVALMQLSGIAQKMKFKGLKTKAEQFVGEIAKERGLTRDELEDRVVPDCGLDEQGKRTFSFGPRSFSFVLTGDLKPMVRDEAGKLRPNLPDPNAKDDAAIAKESLAEWKLLKKQIKDVATIQAGRLEQSMVTGRRWKAEDYEELLVRHPLMTHLVQKVVWAGFDAQGNRLMTFRVTEERDYADPEDHSLSLGQVVTVGVIHPLQMTEAERESWGQVLGDYEIVSPFPQLSRLSYSLEPGEESEDDIQRYNSVRLAAPTLVFGLEKMNWVRGVGLDGGGFDEHSKQFPAANVTAVCCYSGTVGMGYIDPNENLQIEGIYFCSGLRPPSGYGGWHYGSNSKDARIKLKDVPPVVISEVIADMQVLKSKAK